MRLLQRTLGSPEENLALDEALLLEAEAGRQPEVLRLWEWPRPAVVLGSGCKLAEDVDAEACRADGVPILRRSSGGGTVLLGEGCLCFSLVLALAGDERLGEIRPSYRYILGRVAEPLGLPGVHMQGISDLVYDGRKFSGNAQQRKRHHILHHGTILYAFDLPLVSRCLRLPARQPDYRAGRGHDDFIRNLGLPGDVIRERLLAAWQADEAQTQWPAEVVRRLVAEKYATPEWVERR
jgi:lipoate-protein ligase A